MRIIAVRHGQTRDNAKQIIQGHQPGKLSPTGIKQAQALGRLMKKEKLDFIYCSDLKRCKDTLKEISKFHKHVPVVFTEQLRERNFGIFEGQSREKLNEVFQKYKGDPLKFKPKGAESLFEMKERVSEFLKYLKKNHRNQKVLLVVHGGILRSLNSILTRTSLSGSYGKFKFHNTSLSEYEITGSKIKVRRFNEIKHL